MITGRNGSTLRSWQVVAGLAVLAVVVVAVLAVTSRDRTSTPTEDGPPATGMPSASSGDGPTDAEPTMPGARAVTLPDTKDPDAYAGAIAELVFGLSPADSYARGYRDVLLGAIDRDVAGDDYDRLVAVTSRWIPDDATWDRQAAQQLRAVFEVESVVEPEQVVFNSDVPPGHEVRTVSGVQSLRYEDENGEEVREARARSVSVWVYCPPDRNCSLVSVPDEVLR
ncbi:hypothetical protein [Jiangella alkaliphila]|uniref:Uncharacterized protein n=1 Tax=Jiangella alkaliphila TaxID=419479 RepID=A0A1H2GD61_9ACTN|nr:hypothetical protein [Jiangella alkaliphila]SDU17500.1 hypothetical protein SAMN04488563_0430 [Jiangella alkaliphila]